MTEGQRKYYLLKVLMRGMTFTTYANAYNNMATSWYWYYALENFILDILKDSSVELSEANLKSVLNKLAEANSTLTSTRPITNVAIGVLLNTLGTEYAAFRTKFIEALSILGISYTQDASQTSGTSSVIETTWTTPNGNTRKLASNCISSAYLILQPRQETYYAKITYPYFDYKNTTLIDISNAKYRCGENAWWEISNNKFIVNGTGSTINENVIKTNSTPYEDISNCDANIIESTINYVGYNGITNGVCNNTIVFKHSTTDELGLSASAFPSPKNASNPKIKFIIYADHPAVTGYSFSSNIDIEMHSLSEWGD